MSNPPPDFDYGEDCDMSGQDAYCDHCPFRDCVDDQWEDHECDGDYGYGREPAFAVPGGNSALRAATPSNPRNLPCPTCGTPNVLTPADRARGYQCDACADRAESGWGY